MDLILKYASLIDLTGPIYFLNFFLSVFIGFFLYWRAGRHELYESNFLLDLVLFCSLGGLIFGRLLVFVFNFEYFNFSLFKLIFFHVFGGFSFWGFLVGVLIFGFLYLQKSKENLFNVLDLAVPAIVFSALTFYFFQLLIAGVNQGSINSRYLIIDFFFLITFIVFKRLSTKKRQKGFFAGIFFLTIGTFYATLNLIDNWGKFDSKAAISERTVMPVFFMTFGAIIWYKFSKRAIGQDIKGFFALILLNLFKLKRIILSTDEAGRIAKSILFLPYSIFKFFLVLLRMFSKELAAAFWEFLYILGLRKY